MCTQVPFIAREETMKVSQQRRESDEQAECSMAQQRSMTLTVVGPVHAGGSQAGGCSGLRKQVGHLLHGHVQQMVQGWVRGHCLCEGCRGKYK